MRCASVVTVGQNGHLKKRFLEAFKVSGNVTTACSAAGMRRRQTVYEWQEHDDAFAAAFREAEIEATERLEEEARRRAVEGVVKETPIFHNGAPVATITETKYSDTLLIFLLKARAPEKYRERQAIEHSGPGGGPIETRDGLSDVERATRLAALLDIVQRRAETASE